MDTFFSFFKTAQLSQLLLFSSFETLARLLAVQNKRREHSNLRQTPNFPMECDEFLQPLEARGHEIHEQLGLPHLWCLGQMEWS